MRRSNARPSLLFFSMTCASVAALLGALALACSEGSSATGDATPDASAEAPGPRPDGATERDAGGATADASTCAVERAYAEACKGDLTCGAASFDAWCAQEDAVLNSDAFRRGEAKCLTPENCDGAKRKDCQYKSYAGETPTEAQAALVAAYCATCEPGSGTCAARATTYDAVAGPDGVTDVFIAAWELSDPITDEIRTSCTGASLDGGADAGDGGCAKAFASCAGDVYVNHLPDCP